MDFRFSHKKEQNPVQRSINRPTYFYINASKTYLSIQPRMPVIEEFCSLKLHSSPAVVNTTILFAEESLKITAFLHFKFVGFTKEKQHVRKSPWREAES